MDQIRIEALRLDTRIGWDEAERAQPQTVVMSVVLKTDTSRAAATDELTDTVDYHAAVEAIAALVRDSECRLIETLAERVAELSLGFAGVEAVGVEVAKEVPPLTEEAQVSVRIKRKRT